jgi:hypothetical protein
MPNNIGAPGLDNNQATAGSASGQIVGARDTRRSVTVRNTHGTDSCYIGQSGVSSSNGFLLKAGESISIDSTAAVHGIRAGSTNVTICYLETFDA